MAPAFTTDKCVSLVNWGKLLPWYEADHKIFLLYSTPVVGLCLWTSSTENIGTISSSLINNVRDKLMHLTLYTQQRVLGKSSGLVLRGDLHHNLFLVISSMRRATSYKQILEDRRGRCYYPPPPRCSRVSCVVPFKSFMLYLVRSELHSFLMPSSSSEAVGSANHDWLSPCQPYLTQRVVEFLYSSSTPALSLSMDSLGLRECSALSCVLFGRHSSLFTHF